MRGERGLSAGKARGGGGRGRFTVNVCVWGGRTKGRGGGVYSCGGGGRGAMRSRAVMGRGGGGRNHWPLASVI